MKKLFTLFLTIAMVLSMSVNAFAATVTEAGNQTATVTGTVQNASDKIDISLNWSDSGLTFTYVKDDYNKETGKKESYWDGYEAIEIINYSSVDVTCAFSFTALENWTDGNLVYSMNEGYGVGNTWDESTNTLTLLKGSDGELGDISRVYETKAIVTVEVAEDAPGIESETNLGTLTVTISTVTE